MRGDQYLRKRGQFRLVYNEGRSWVNGNVVMRALPNGRDITRYGFAVSRQVGGAVVRNRMKRQLREILRQNRLWPGWDIIFIARASAAKASYAILEKSVRRLLYKAGLLMGEYEGVGPGAN